MIPLSLGLAVEWVYRFGDFASVQLYGVSAKAGREYRIAPSQGHLLVDKLRVIDIR